MENKETKMPFYNCERHFWRCSQGYFDVIFGSKNALSSVFELIREAAEQRNYIGSLILKENHRLKAIISQKEISGNVPATVSLADSRDLNSFVLTDSVGQD